MSVEQYSLVAHDWLNLGFIINDLAQRVVGQELHPTSSPTFGSGTITGNLDIGGDLVVTGDLAISGLTETRVLFAGADGVISDDAGLTYALATDILTAGTYNATDEDNVLQIDGTTVFKTGPFGEKNLFIGNNVGDVTLGGASVRNLGIGQNVFISLTTAKDNVALGDLTLQKLTSGVENFALGSNTLKELTTGDDNVVIGTSCLTSVEGGRRNVAIGALIMSLPGTALTSNNVLIGYFSGRGVTGSNNVFLGGFSGANQRANADLLIIDNQDRGSIAAELTDCLIYGVFNSTVTSQTLRFNVGNLSVVSGTPYQYLINDTHEDSDGGRESRIYFKGEQSGGELTTLVMQEVGHDGAVDDEKGYWDLFVNDGDDGNSPTKQFRIQSTGDWVINKTSGVGIKVDLAAPTFGFADIIGDQFSKNTGATKPTLTTYNGTVQAWQFSDGDEAYLSFHIPHDYVPGSDIHLHVHWSQTSATATGGTLDFKYFAIYAKGWNQVSGSTFTSTPITATFSTIDINDGDSGLSQYQHFLTEVTISAATATGALFDRDDFEPDGVIELTLEMDANNLTNSGAVLDPFIHYVDIHYQSTSLIGTKSREPNFYA